MKSKIVDYICEPNNYKIQIVDSTYGMITVALLIDEKPILYRRYRSNTLDYDTGNRIVKKFCEHLQEEKLRSYEEDDMYMEIVKDSLEKVYNRLGLPIWQKK